MMSYFCLRALRSDRLVRKRLRYATVAVDFALRFQPDIICFNEILPNLVGNEVRQSLRTAGFTVIAEGMETRHPHPLEMATFLAVREEAHSIPIELPHLDETGGGGGICGLYLPQKNTTVFGLHLAIAMKKRPKQLQVLSEYIVLERVQGRKVIVAGDFNCSLAVIQNHPAFLPLALQGCDVPTNMYAQRRVIGKIPAVWGMYPDLDHVLWSSEFHLQQASSHAGNSDHDLVFCELKETF